MSFDELTNNIELFRLVKKVPSEKRKYLSSSLNKNIEISINKKLNLNKINSLYKEYLDNITEWINEDVAKSEDSADLVELLYCLNPDENMPEKDKAVVRRILDYNMKLSFKPPVDQHIVDAISGK